MTKPLLACLLVACCSSCTFTTQNTGQLFVNQKLLESEIRTVQPANEIEMTVQSTNGHDSILIVKLEVDPKIPDDSLNGDRAKLVLSSFITSLPDLNSFTTCRIIFVRKTGSVVSTSSSIAFDCPVTPQVLTNLGNFKDSTRASVGYIDTGWTYVNKDLNLSLPLKKDWYYVSEEQDSLVYYAIGSDLSQLPQYRTDTDGKVSFKTLYGLDPGDSRFLLSISKNNSRPANPHLKEFNYSGAAIYVGMVMNRFDSEDEYLAAMNEMILSRKLAEKEIHTYHFGNADFRGQQASRKLKTGETIRHISAIKRFKRVSLVLGIDYSSEQELEEIKQELSGLKIK